MYILCASVILVSNATKKQQLNPQSITVFKLINVRVPNCIFFFEILSLPNISLHPEGAIKFQGRKKKKSAFNVISFFLKKEN